MKKINGYKVIQQKIQNEEYYDEEDLDDCLEEMATILPN